MTYWIFCKFTTPRRQLSSEILEQHAETCDNCVERANNGQQFCRS